MRLFGKPRRDQLEHLALARGQPVERPAVAVGRERLDEPRRHDRVEQRLARVRGADRARELLRLHVLEQVAGGAGAERGQQPSRRRGSSSARSRAPPGTRSRSSRIAADAVEPRHHEVHQHDVRRAAARPRRPPPRRRPPRPTTSMPSCSSRNVRSPSRTTAWSSTTSTRIGSATRRPPAAPSCPRPAPSGSRAVPPSRCAALLHRRQPEPPRAQLGRLGVEARRRRRRPRARSRRPSPRSEPDDHALRLAWRSAFWSASWAMRSTSRSRAGVGRRARRRARARSPPACSAAQHLDVLAQRAAQAVALEVGRAQLEDQRAQLVERLARQRLQLRRPARPPRPGRARAASRPPRRSSTRPNSFWLTASCSSSASRLRSATIESSRLRSYSRALVIAIAACAASSSISSWSSSREVRRRRPSRSGRRRRSRPSGATIGTPRNERMSGCARGHQPRKRGWSWMSRVRNGASRLEHRAEHAVRRGSGPSEAISSSLMPGGEERAGSRPRRRAARARRSARRPARARCRRAAAAPPRPTLGRDREHRVADRPQRGAQTLGHLG